MWPFGSYPLPSTSYSFSFVQIFVMVISFWVNVPVLSEQIAVVAPRVSTETKDFTMAFLSAILFMPIDKTIVTTAVSPSGIAATARETATIKLSKSESPVLKYPTTNTIIQTTTTRIAKSFDNLFNCLCNGVSLSSTWWRLDAIFPISVSEPVWVTIPLACP